MPPARRQPVIILVTVVPIFILVLIICTAETEQGKDRVPRQSDRYRSHKSRQRPLVRGGKVGCLVQHPAGRTPQA